MAHDVAIIGGGYAGMAAAVTLVERGIRPVVYESGAVPGGRARRLEGGGDSWDNGQHVLLGACAELLRLMRAVGVPSDGVLRVPFELRYADGFALRALWLPAPLGLLGGMLLAKGVPLSERLGARRFMAAMRRTNFRLAEDCTVVDLLARHGQNGRIGHYLWRPLGLLALNTPPALGSANAFLAVLRDSLGGGDHASDILLPTVDLSRLFPEPAAQFVRANGGEVRLSTPAPELQALRRVHRRVIIAVGPQQLKSLLPGFAPEYEYQPGCTCYLQYHERARLPFPMLGLAEGIVQWVFDRGMLLGETGRIACVIGAQGDHQQMQEDELAAACHRELARHYPRLGAPLRARVVSEERATIACTPGVKRIGPQTPLADVLVAGDYTDSEYPPTLEAAVRSGIRAAGCVPAG